MIQCPFCKAPLTETSAACPQCNLDLNRASAVLGPVPMLSNQGVTDLAGVLAPKADRPLLQALGEFHLRFPQSRASILFQRFDPDYPVETHLFWLFNTAHISGAENKHGANRDLLIGIDPEQHSAGLMIGYGLEPFLPQQALDHILVLARPALEDGNFGEGALDILDRLSRLMAGVCQELAETVGIDGGQLVEERPSDY